MPMKDWLYRLRPVQLYIILVLSVVYFLVQLFLSHITHALTLLVNSYHMLCNIIALSGCIITIKHSKRSMRSCDQHHKTDSTQSSSREESCFMEVCTENQKIPTEHPNHQQHQHHNHRHHHELKLRNTFGWTRIDILTMLIVCIFLASLSFSLLVEALQTLIHIDHQDTMHLPIPVLILGGIGLILNGLCYLLIGGYTLHQGSFLQITSNGDVVLDSSITSSGECLKPGERRLSKTKRVNQQTTLNEFQTNRKRQGLTEMFRDVSSTIFVICCALTVYLADDEQVTKFVDPIISIFSCTVLLLLSYPYMKESCLILLQTIPASIDIENFKQTLLSTFFNEIVSVHDLHIWQLTASKYVSTAHIIFQNPTVYVRIMDDVKHFFHDQGITIVTIQPEFKSTKMPSLPEECLVQCHDITCVEKHCCQRTILAEVIALTDKQNRQEQHQQQQQGQQLQSQQHQMEQQHQQQHKSKFETLLNAKLLNITRSMVERSKSTDDLSTSEQANESTNTIANIAVPTMMKTINGKFSSEPQLLLDNGNSSDIMDVNTENILKNFKNQDNVELKQYCGHVVEKTEKLENDTK